MPGSPSRSIIRNPASAGRSGTMSLASTLPPDRVTEILNAAGIKTVPTGIAHGTITAVIDRTGYEITTLRRDVETDGRHAKVEFTENWQEDAARRDFTMNALYVDAEGTLYDYFNGVEDAKSGHVRFIGDPRSRIREDVLRILRFFRFYAHFGKGDADAEGLAACRELAPLIPSLSVERIAHEIIKLLAAENPLPALRLMKDSGVINYFLPEAADYSRLQALLDTEKKLGARQEFLVRLAALLPEDENAAQAVAKRLKFSNRNSAMLGAIVLIPAMLRGNVAPANVRLLIYRHGAENVRAAAFLVGGRISEALTLIASWKIPLFPIKGEDVMKLGMPAGPKVGETLRAVEDWWIKGDFKADRAACLKEASKHK